MMKRRSFLTWMTAAGALLAALGVVFVRVFRRANLETTSTEIQADNPRQAMVANALIQHFPYLKLDSSGILQFAQDFLEDNPSFEPRQHSNSSEISQMAMTYLISTDFFPNGAQESQPVHYKGYNMPYYELCGNPFAQFPNS